MRESTRIVNHKLSMGRVIRTLCIELVGPQKMTQVRRNPARKSCAEREAVGACREGPGTRAKAGRGCDRIGPFEIAIRRLRNAPGKRTQGTTSQPIRRFAESDPSRRAYLRHDGMGNC